MSLFAPGKVSAIVGYPYTSKTPMALDIAIDIAAGRALEQRRVLYLASEGARNARRKAGRIARAKNASLSQLDASLTVASAPSGFLQAESCAQLIHNCRAERYGVVVLDTYGSALDGSIDRNSNAYSDCLKQLGDASDAYQLLVIVLLHCRKDKMRGNKPPTLQDIDGHNSVAGAIQGALALSRPSDDNKALIEVSCLRAPDEEFSPYYIQWTDVGPLGDGGLRADIASAPEKKAVSSDVAANAQRVEARTTQALLELLNAGPTTLKHFREQLNTTMGRDAKVELAWKLVDEGLITITTLGNGSQQIARAARGVASTNAAAKREGFLGGGKKKLPGGEKVG